MAAAQQTTAERVEASKIKVCDDALKRAEFTHKRNWIVEQLVRFDERMAEHAPRETSSRLDICKQATINKMTLEVAGPGGPTVSIKVQKLINTRVNSYGNVSIDLTDDKLLALTEALSEGTLTLKFNGQELAKIEVIPGDPPVAVVKIGGNYYRSTDSGPNSFTRRGQLLADVIYLFGKAEKPQVASVEDDVTLKPVQVLGEEKRKHDARLESLNTFKKFKALYQESLSNIGHAKTSFWGFFKSLFSSASQLNTTRYTKASYELNSDERRANQFENLMDAAGLVRSVIQSKRLSGASVSYTALKFGNNKEPELCLKITFKNGNNERSIYIRPNAERRRERHLTHYNCRIFELSHEEVVVPQELNGNSLRSSRDLSLALYKVFGAKENSSSDVQNSPQQSNRLSFSQCAQAIGRVVERTGISDLKWSGVTLRKDGQIEGRAIKIEHGGKTYVIGAASSDKLSIYEATAGGVFKNLDRHSNFKPTQLAGRLQKLLSSGSQELPRPENSEVMQKILGHIGAFQRKYQDAGIAVKVTGRSESNQRVIEVTRKGLDKTVTIKVGVTVKEPNYENIIGQLSEALISPAERNRAANLSDALQAVSKIGGIQVYKVEHLFPGSSALEACLKITLGNRTIVFRPSFKREYDKNGAPKVSGRYYVQGNSESDLAEINLNETFSQRNSRPSKLKELIAAILDSSTTLLTR